MIILKQHTMNFLITMMHLVEPVKLGMVKCSMGPVGEEVLEEIQDYHMKDYLFHCWETRKPIFGVAMVNQEGIQQYLVGKNYQEIFSKQLVPVFLFPGPGIFYSTNCQGSQAGIRKRLQFRLSVGWNKSKPAQITSYLPSSKAKPFLPRKAPASRNLQGWKNQSERCQLLSFDIFSSNKAKFCESSRSMSFMLNYDKFDNYDVADDLIFIKINLGKFLHNRKHLSSLFQQIQYTASSFAVKLNLITQLNIKNIARFAKTRIEGEKKNIFGIDFSSMVIRPFLLKNNPNSTH